MQVVVIALSVFLASFRSCFMTTQLDKYEVTKYGLYTSTDEETIVDPHTATGTRKFIKNVVFTDQTYKVPAQLGTRFGFGAVLVGKPEGRSVTVRRVTLFPKKGITNPVTGKTTYQDEAMLSKVIGAESHFGYSFDHPWEMVPGPWTFQVWYGDQKLLEQTFTVVNSPYRKHASSSRGTQKAHSLPGPKP